MSRTPSFPVAVAAAALAALAGCALVETPPPAPPAGPPGLTLTPVTFDALPGWRQDRHAEALAALRRSCARIARMADEQPVGQGGVGGLAADWRAPCAAVARTPPAGDAAARYVLETWFVPHRAANGADADGLFTGYYEAELRGARRRGGRYQFPVYAPPPDLETYKRQHGGRHLTRSEIGGGALAGRGLELLWADDAADVYFLHVQGSGRVAMEDGRTLRLGYAGDNGHAYASIGRELVARGLIAAEALSMQTIREWIAANPVQGVHMMAQNPRYIFFREVAGDGPVGAEGTALTPGRSLAVDAAFVPLGVPVWVETTEPGDAKRPLRRLFVAQDTGSAIKGPVRGDIFFGFGADAARQAGIMKARGRYYLLLPRPPAPPKPPAARPIS